MYTELNESLAQKQNVVCAKQFNFVVVVFNYSLIF
jgi:hypothetical protein